MTMDNTITTPGRAAWLAARKSGIGGSDIAAVLGLSPWASPLDVWLDKTGQAPDAEPKNTEAIYWGATLEDVVAREYAIRSGRKVQRINTMLRDPQRGWMIANIDRAIVADGSRARVAAAGGQLLGATGILECKTASAYLAGDWSGPDGSDAMPVYYAAQVMWYLAISGLDTADVAVLIGGQQYAVRTIERDDETIRGMIERAEAFWLHSVIAGNAPEPTSARDAARLFARDDGSLRAIDDDALLLTELEQLRTLREQLKGLGERESALADALKLAIGQCAGLSVAGAAVATWKATRDSTRVDWQAVANDLAALVGPDALAPIVRRHTTTQPGSRRFILK